MKTKTIMLIAGDPSGDANAADLVRALAEAIPNSQFRLTDAMQPLTTPLPPKFFGAGGPKMAEAGVELALDLTAESVIGISDVLKKLPKFKKIFCDLLKLAITRQPDLIILVDYAGFNRRFAHAIKNYIRAREKTFFNWRPKIVQYVSPQVWASRPSRADKMAKDIDLLLCLFPFEKDWYAKRVPELKVEFVGHPMFDRYAAFPRPLAIGHQQTPPQILLLPGSRRGELKRHLPVMLEAAKQITAKQNVRFKMVLPNEEMKKLVTGSAANLSNLEIQIGGLADAFAQTTLAIASTGTVTLECAYFSVPTIAIYKTSWLTFQIAKQIVSVKFLAMPNLLANEEIFPEFIQDRATPENLAREAIDLLNNSARREAIKSKLEKIVATLGGPGAGQRATDAIVKLL